MLIQSIFATDENGGIGINNSLPWPKNSLDMCNFFELTSNTMMVMGSNTWHSLPSKLKSRPHIVLSRKSLSEMEHKGEYPDYVLDYTKPIEDIKSELEQLSIKFSMGTVSIIGGKMVYEALNPIVDVIHHTTIKGTYECDTFLDINVLTDNHSVIYYKDSQVISGLTLSKYQRKTKTQTK